MAENESVRIIDRNGKSICTIDCPQGWQSWITIPTPVPFLGIRHVNTWTNPEIVARYAWFQIFNIVQSIREPSLVTEQTCCRCILCRENLVYPKYAWLRKHVWTNVTGFSCQNKKCSMYNVLFPIRIALHLHEMPEEIMMEILQACQGKLIVWTDKGK